MVSVLAVLMCGSGPKPARSSVDNRLARKYDNRMGIAITP